MELAFSRKLVYTNTVLSIFAIAISIILAVPKLKGYLEKPNIRIDVPVQFFLAHDFGNIFVNLPVSVENSGNSPFSISRIQCLIKDESGSLWDLPAQLLFFPHFGNPSEVYVFGGVTLFPGDRWTPSIRFYQLLSESDEEKINNLKTKILKHLKAKKIAMSITSQEYKLLSESLATEEEDVLKRHFKLNKGNYRLFLAFFSDSKMLGLRGYTFTLYENSITDLRQLIEREFGHPIVVDVCYKGTSPRLRPIANKDAQDEYTKLKFSQ